MEISQNSKENICARDSFLIKLQASGLQLYQKGVSGTGGFCEFCEISKWYLLAGIGYKEVRKVKTQQLCFVNNSVLKPLVLHMKKYIYKKPLHTTRFVKTKHKNETLLMN